jgi:oligosaccharide repeat unit polymerase
MYAVVIALLLLLLALNFYVTRSLLAPTTLFAAMWTGNVTALWLSGSFFYPVGGATLMMFFVGALAFSAGGLAVLLARTARPAREVSPQRHSYVRRWLDALAVLCVLGFPLYFRYIEELAGRSLDSLLALLFYVRHETVRASADVGGLNPIQNLPILAMFVAFGMVLENDGTRGRKWRMYFSLLMALVYTVMVGAKAGPVMFALIVAFLVMVRQRRFRLKSALVAAAATILLFVAGLVFVNWAYMNVAAPLDTAKDTVRSYWLGGLVALDQIVQERQVVRPTQNVDRFFRRTAKSLGADVEVVSPHAEFVEVSPGGRRVNVYTLYFSYYPQFGWWGVLLFPAVAGAFATWLYLLSLEGWPPAMVLFAALAAGIVLSSGADFFFTALNFLLKAFLAFIFLYSLPRLRFAGRPMPLGQEAHG